MGNVFGRPSADLQLQLEIERERTRQALLNRDAAIGVSVDDLASSFAALRLELKQSMALQEARFRQGHYRSTTAPDAGQAISEAATIVPFGQLLGIPSSVSLEPTSPSVVTAAAASTEAFAAARVGGAKEEAVQTALLNLLTRLSDREDAKLKPHDTHAKTPLRAPLGKIDVSFTAKGQKDLAWSNLVTFIEVKPTLLSAPAHHGAISQLYERSTVLLQQQPERPIVIAALASADRIEFWRFERDADSCAVGRMQRTGLSELDMSGTSEGLRQLAMLVDAAPVTLGFVPASWPPSLEDESGEPIVITDVLRRVNSRGTIVWRGARHGVDVAIKMVSSEASGKAEAAVIRALEACEHVPTIISTVSSGTSWGFAMTPVGEHLAAGSGAGTVARALLGIVDALGYAHSKGYLHRDVSAGNVVWDPVRERGCLLDWHIAVEQSAVTQPENRARGLTVTGTRLFTAASLSRKGHVRCVEDDLESVLYVLLDIATGSKLPWRHAAEADIDALKVYYMTKTFEDDVLPLCPADFQSLVERLHQVIAPSIGDVQHRFELSQVRHALSDM